MINFVYFEHVETGIVVIYLAPEIKNIFNTNMLIYLYFKWLLIAVVIRNSYRIGSKSIISLHLSIFRMYDVCM